MTDKNIKGIQEESAINVSDMDSSKQTVNSKSRMSLSVSNKSTDFSEVNPSTRTITIESQTSKYKHVRIWFGSQIPEIFARYPSKVIEARNRFIILILLNIIVAAITLVFNNRIIGSIQCTSRDVDGNIIYFTQLAILGSSVGGSIGILKVYSPLMVLSTMLHLLCSVFVILICLCCCLLELSISSGLSLVFIIYLFYLVSGINSYRFVTSLFGSRPRRRSQSHCPPSDLMTTQSSA